MSSLATKPGRRYYGRAILIPLVVCSIVVSVAYLRFPGLPGAWQAEMSLAKLTQVVVAGAQDSLSGYLPAFRPGRAASCSPCDPPPRGCTIFTVVKGDRVFFGGNGDWINFDSNYYWVDPGSDRHYGAVYFGVPDNVQQGFNEKGLAYDSNGLPLAPIDTHPGREPVYGGYTGYPIQILQACATVKEVIAWVQEHRWHEAMHDQMHFADAGGDAVVIGAGPDGKVALTRKPSGEGYLVSTNFNLANPSNGSWPCWRYDRARELLQEIHSPDELTAERAASVLDAVHVESTTVWTILSVVGDLPRGLVYVYLFHQFDAPIVLNVADEIARAPDPGPVRELFPEETVRQADQAYRRLVARGLRCDSAGLIWAGLSVLSLVALLLMTRSRRRALLFWVLVVTVLGPIGLLAWLVISRGGRRDALVETVGDLIPYVIGMVGALLVAVLASQASQSALLQLLAFLGLPLVTALFIYQAPLLARATGTGYVRTLLRRLPAVIVSTNLGLAGVLAVGLPAVKWRLERCGLGPLTVLSWWAIAALGALGGGLLLYAYHAWGVRHGFSAWSALLRDTGTGCDRMTRASSPSWPHLWPWISVSFVILAAGVALGAVGSSLVAGAA